MTKTSNGKEMSRTILDTVRVPKQDFITVLGFLLIAQLFPGEFHGSADSSWGGWGTPFSFYNEEIEIVQPSDREQVSVNAFESTFDPFLLILNILITTFSSYFYVKVSNCILRCIGIDLPRVCNPAVLITCAWIIMFFALRSYAFPFGGTDSIETYPMSRFHYGLPFPSMSSDNLPSTPGNRWAIGANLVICLLLSTMYSLVVHGSFRKKFKRMRL